MSLKATPLPPASLDPPPLRVVPATSIVRGSPAPLGLLSAPFSVSIRWLLSGPRHVVSTRTQISPRRAWGTRRTFRSCAAPSRAPTHTHGVQTLLERTLRPDQGERGLGGGLVRVPMLQAGCPRVLGGCLSRWTELGLPALLCLALRCFSPSAASSSCSFFSTG